jgi:hypothetical protein
VSHKARTELVNTDTQMNEEPMTPTPQATPRTDELVSVHDEASEFVEVSAGYKDLLDHARSLERSLSAAEARVKEMEDALRDAKLPGAIKLACWFHELYEEHAPEYGYETRPETRVFNATTPNGKLMIAVCREIMQWHNSKIDAALAGKQEEGR